MDAGDEADAEPEFHFAAKLFGQALRPASRAARKKTHEREQHLDADEHVVGRGHLRWS